MDMIIYLTHPTTQADRSTQELVLPVFLASVENANTRIQARNSSLQPGMLPGDLWPSEVFFFPEVFETTDEAVVFLTTKASASFAAACKTNKGAKSTPRENLPAWTFVCLAQHPRRA